MNLLMEDNFDVTRGLEISLVGQLDKSQWKTMMPRIHYRIILENENKQAIVEVGADELPTCELESLRYGELFN